jgi:integrase/recombinase XerD
VIGTDLRPVPVADAYLRHIRFGRGDAESTTKSYAGAVALDLTCHVVAQLDWRLAADRLGSFILWLRHTPSNDDRPGASVVSACPGA